MLIRDPRAPGSKGSVGDVSQDVHHRNQMPEGMLMHMHATICESMRCQRARGQICGDGARRAHARRARTPGAVIGARLRGVVAASQDHWPAQAAG